MASVLTQKQMVSLFVATASPNPHGARTHGARGRHGEATRRAI